MKHLAPSFFRSFACAAGRCPDSCCRAGWEIIPDAETLRLYQALPGPAGDRLRAGIVPPSRDEQPAPASERTQCEDPLLRHDSHRVCVLLDADGLCHVQKNFGHEALCRVCRAYPRFHREFGNLTEHGLSLSCPTAYALAVNAPLQWETWEDDAPIVPNELDPETYLRLRRGRELALDLLGQERLPLRQRMTLVLRLAKAIQHAPEQLVRHDYALRLRRWQTLPIPSASSGTSRQLPCNGNAVMQLAERFAALEILSPAWGEKLEQLRALLQHGVGAPCAPLQGELLETDKPERYARYLACSLYKYWLDALDDGNLLGRVERSVSMTLLGLAMDRAFPSEGPHLQRISREIEHCEENLTALLKNT